MRKNLLTHLLTLIGFLSTFTSLRAQTIHVVPNPNAPDLFAYSSGGILSGFAGTPIVLKNSLVGEYNPTGTSDPAVATLQLAVYTGGDSLHLIPNPDNGQGVYFQSVQLVLNDSLFFIYLDAAGKQRLASFDGTAITLYPNPDAGLGYIGSPRIFNNKLYVAYSNTAGGVQFGTFNGSGITLIPNPDVSGSNQGFYFNYATVFNNTLCSRYIETDGTKHIAVLNGSGTAWTLLPNPDNTTRGVIPAFPIIYHNKIYFQYYSAANEYQFIQYDGVNNPTLIPNPDDLTDGGVAGFPIIFNDTLFLQYYSTANTLQLAKFGGSSISLVPNPDASPNGFYNTPIIYNNNLYIFYVTTDGLHHLAQYQTASNSLHVYANPDGGLGYWDQPIVYDNNLYFMYYNAQSQFQLGYFGGTSIKLVSNPPGIYNGAAGTNGYTGYPLIWNNLLYMQFGSVPYGDAGNLAFINGSTLPVTLLDFSAQKNGSSSLLQWKVTSETNNAYFNIEHSTDGTNFSALGKVNGHGTIATQQQYQFTDITPSAGVNYYRLQQIDYDGNSTYSKVVTLDFDNIPSTFKLFPNPAASKVTASIPISPSPSLLKVYDVTGKIVFEKQISANTVSQAFDVSRLTAGIYQCTLLQGTQQQTTRLLKK